MKANQTTETGEQFYRDTMKLISNECSREAEQLMAKHGFLAIENPAELDDACERIEKLNGGKAARAVEKWERTYIKSVSAKAFEEYEDLTQERLIDRQEAAYLLGIAVGAKLGTIGGTVGQVRRRA